MPIAEFGMPIPEEYIHRHTLLSFLRRPQFEIMNDYIKMLQWLQRQPISLDDFDNLAFPYQPRLPDARNDHFNPVIPILEVPYMLTAAIITNQIHVNEQLEEMERLDLKGKIRNASLHLLDLMSNRISFPRRLSEPTRLGDSHGNQFTQMSMPWGQGLVEVARRVGVPDLYIRWYENNPNFPSDQQHKPSSLAAEFRFRLVPVDFITEAMIVQVDIHENSGEENNGGNILDKYLAPYHPFMKVVEGYSQESRQLESLLLRSLDLERLNHH